MGREPRDDGRTTAAKVEQAKGRQQEDRNEAAGLPRKNVEADDHPDENRGY